MNIPTIVARLCPHASPLGLAIMANADEVLPTHVINSPLRIAHFLAQVFEETGGLSDQDFVENCNYRPETLVAKFSTRFKTIQDAQPYAHNPEAFANYVYADANRSPRSRLGNTQPGDGWRFIGRGPGQATGRYMYTLLSKILGIDLVGQPELACDPRYALPITCVIWSDIKKCNPLADADDVVGITEKINGGRINLDVRIKYLTAIKREMGLAA